LVGLPLPQQRRVLTVDEWHERQVSDERPRLKRGTKLDVLLDDEMAYQTLESEKVRWDLVVLWRIHPDAETHS
jgi:hypothetical protein